MSNKTGETLVMSGIDNPDGLLSEEFFDQQKNPDTYTDDILGIPNGSRKSRERLKKAGNVTAGALVAGALLTLGALGHYVYDKEYNTVNNNRPMIEGDTTGEIVAKAGNLTADLCAISAIKVVVLETGVDTHSSEEEKKAAQEEVNGIYSNCLEAEFTKPVDDFLRTAGLPVLGVYLEFLESNNS